MNRRHWKFSLVYTLIVIALPYAINGSELATRSENQIAMFDTEKEPEFSYVVNSVTTKPCILANMTIAIKVPYKTKENKIEYKSLKVPDKNVIIDGHCSALISYMKITWNENKKERNSIKFTFINDHSTFSLFSIDLNIYRDEKNFKSATDKKQWFRATSDIDLRLFVAPVQDGILKCNETTLKVEEGEVIMKNVSLIAFNRNDTVSSPKEIKCSEKKKGETFPYIIRDANNNICTMARMSVSVTVPYKLGNEMKTAKIELPTSGVNVSGNCLNVLTKMILTWPVSSVDCLENATKNENKIWFLFSKQGKTSELYDIRVEIFTDKKNFPGIEVGKRISIDTGFDASLFPAPVVNGIHSCPEETTVTTIDGNITISDVLLVAFDAEKDFASKKVIDCRGILFEEDFNYVVNKTGTDSPCILANMLITVITYKGNKEVKSKVPANAVATGICTDKYSRLVLSWHPDKSVDNVQNNIRFHIGRNKTHFFVSQIAATIYPDANNKSKISGASYTGINLFSAAMPNGMYRCTNSIFNIDLDDIRLTITDVTFIAFYDKENILRNVAECPEPNPIISTSTEPGPTLEPKPTPKPEPKPTPKPEPKPTPKPEPKPNADYDYSVTNSTTNVTCIAANMSIFIEVPYKTKEDKDEKGTLNVPRNASVTGECGDKLSRMELNWIMNESKENNTVTVNFEKDDSNYFIRSMNLSIYLDDHNFPNHNESRYNASTESLDQFSTPLNRVYKCARNTSITAKNAEIVITNVTWIAFNTNQNITSLKSVDCTDDDTGGSNAGAIAGGIIGGLIVLAGIISLVVLCRRRRGY